MLDDKSQAATGMPEVRMIQRRAKILYRADRDKGQAGPTDEIFKIRVGGECDAMPALEQGDSQTDKRIHISGASEGDEKKILQ